MTVQELHDLYTHSIDLHAEGTCVISCDEKTGIQALEREITPMKEGQCERQDSEYERHGTQCLIANFEVATGKIISPSVGDTRTEDDFVEHIKRTLNTAPDNHWVIIVDQLNTHKSASLVKFVAEVCDIDIDLGVKGKSGILKNMKTRQKFLEDANHKIRFFYTPKHASWLNQIEVWFSILSKRLLKRLSVKSTADLKDKILSFIDYFNKTAAKVFKWTYRGRPLTA
jgi:hypothetical protein